MTIVVEIASRTGTRAYKEYDTPSVDAAIDAANHELRPYPEFRVTGFWVDRERAVQRKPKEEDLTAAGSILLMLGAFRPKYRPTKHAGAEWEVAVERPTYDLAVFKLQGDALRGLLDPELET